MSTSKNKLILAGGRFENTTARARLAETFADFVASPQKSTLVIHFHGGLVSRADGEAIADRLLPVYQDAGAYPLFIIWQAGLGETLRNNWQDIVKQDAFSLLKERVLQFVLGKLDQAPGEMGGEVEVPSVLTVQDEIVAKEATGDEPFAERNPEADKLDEDLNEAERRQLGQLIGQDPRLPTATAELLAGEAGELAPELEQELETARTKKDDGEKFLFTTSALIVAGLRIAGRTVGRLSTGRSHGVYTTIVEEVARELKGGLIGGIVWKHMKQDTADAFAGHGETHGGTALLEEIAALHAAGHKPRLILVGHSAGAIYICHLLLAAQQKLPADVRFEVVLLAPACTFVLLDRTLTEAGDLIGSFRSFAMQDELERQDAIFPPVYNRSLLYFVSGLVEDEIDAPLVGMQRYYSGRQPFDAAGKPAIARALDKLSHLQQVWIWSKSSAGLGLNTLALKHGDFDNEEKTLASVAHLVTQGFV